jgi:CBS domain-containing protein
MSRSKEGRTRDENVQPTGQGGADTGRNLDEQLGAKGQTDYSSGRESWNEFPRRTRSRREQAENIDERQYTSGQIRPTGYTRTGYRGGEQSGRYGSEAYDRMRGRYGFEGHGRHGYTEGHGRHTYSDLRSGRADHEDFDETRGRGRYRGYERENDYDRERTYRSERSMYDQPYGRESFSGQYGDYDRGFDPGTYRLGWGTGREATYEERDSWRGERYERNVLRCREIMTKDVTTASPQTLLREIADRMEDENVGSIPIVENGRLVGIVTDRDIVCRAVAEGRDSRAVTASEVMSEDLVTCAPDDTVIEAIRKMGEHQIRRLPVCDTNGRLRGIIAIADVALEAERDRDLANALEQISQPTPNRSRKV